MDFLSTISNYFRATFDPKAISREQPTQNGDSELEITTKPEGTFAIEAAPSSETKAKEVKETAPAKKVLPKLKCQLFVSNFRVAIIEDVFTKQPQAISLNVSPSSGCGVMAR